MNINTKTIKNAEYRTRMEKQKLDEVSLTEIFAYIGLLILFGLGNKNDVAIDLLWSDKSLVHFSYFAKAIMSRERYQLISRYIAFDDIEGRNKLKFPKHF